MVVDSDASAEQHTLTAHGTLSLTSIRGDPVANAVLDEDELQSCIL